MKKNTKNCSECGRLNNGNLCIAGGIHKTNINIQTTEHDIRIFDTKYQDNAIVITKQEAKHLINLLCKELGILTIKDLKLKLKYINSINELNEII